MPEFKLAAIATIFALAVRLLLQFNQGIALPKWLAPFSLTGLLALMMLLLPWIQKGSALAFVVGYVAIGFLVLNLLVLFSLAHLPGKVVKLSSSRSRKAGAMLLGLVGRGLGMLLKTSVGFVAQGMAHISAVVMNAISQRTSGTASQKLLGSGIVWG
jgi:hypothetical protein